ncbi:hypothetical protein [Aureispira sp. CCB-QB1]|uniref:hypothetical protein n=1 Tax=Aureispira sp. CCB-QB1 TaxID=1313421 RepID=UPI000698CDB2|nr:hypothetical protein [Aureispira sp. CCB-QB1]
MKDNFIERLSHASNIGFFQMLNKKESVKVASGMLDLFQQKWNNQKGHERGGIVSSTYDVLHAILDCVGPTMEDVRKKQPELFVQSILDEKIFVFIYRKTLISKINKGGKHISAELKPETIGNQLKRLMEAGVLIEKRNYNLRRAKNGELENPLPSDLNPKGRGKVQYFFNPKVLVFNSAFDRLKTYLNNSFQQYRVNPFYLKRKLNKTIIDKPTNVNNQKASAIAESESKTRINKELGRRLSQKNKISPRQFDSKKEFNTHQLLELCRARLFDGRVFTDVIEKGSLQAIEDRIKQTIEAVEAYNSEKVKTYTAREKYKNSTRKEWMLRKYREKLPTPYRAAIEIMSFAIQKQEKNAISKGYLCKIKRHNNDPVQLFTSSNFEYALNYSISDWRKINDNFFIKHKSYSAYCTIVGMVGKIYTYILDLAYQSQSIALAYTESLQACGKLQTKINQNTILTESNKKALNVLIKTKFAPLFSSLSQEEKERLRAAAKNKAHGSTYQNTKTA